MPEQAVIQRPVPGRTIWPARQGSFGPPPSRLAPATLRSVETLARVAVADHDRAVPARRLPAGGRAAVEIDGRPLSIAPGMCRALIDDRRSVHQCQRRGWFALHDTGDVIVRPLCATHLRRLATRGGAVTEARAG